MRDLFTRFILLCFLIGFFTACSSANTSPSSADFKKKSFQVMPPKGGMEQILSSDSTQVTLENYTTTNDYSRGLGFGKETEVDKALEGHEFFVTDIQSAKKKGSVEIVSASKQTKSTKNKHLYTLQFATVGNFDAAQKRKYELMEKYGLSLVLKFDPPFYKLQGGHYSDKQAAEDRAADLRDSGISAFIVKLR